VSKPAHRIVVDKQRRQQANLVVAGIDPNASVEERLAKIDEVEKVGTKPVNEVDEANKLYLAQIFGKWIEEWPEGSADVMLAVNRPPSNSLIVSCMTRSNTSVKT
jgi:hypothetical protein